MAEIRVKEGESLDNALRRFKRQCQRSGIQAELFPEYVDTAVMFAHDLSQMNRKQLAEIKDCLQKIKSEAAPM